MSASLWGEPQVSIMPRDNQLAWLMDYQQINTELNELLYNEITRPISLSI